MSEHASPDAWSGRSVPPSLLPADDARLGDDALVSDVIDFASLLQDVLEADEITAGTFVVTATAAPMLSSVDIARLAGATLDASPSEEFMIEAEGIRERMAAASAAVLETCGFVPLLTPDEDLSEFRAAIVEKSAPAFVAAAQAKGRKLEGRDEITAAGRAMSAYLTASDRYHAMAEELCPDAPDTGWLASRLLLRAHFRSAAHVMGIDWVAVADQCRLRPTVTVKALGSLPLNAVPFSSVYRIKQVVGNRKGDLDIETAIAFAIRDAAAADNDRLAPAA